MEVTQNMRDDVALHNWKLMNIDRCRVTWGQFDNFRFPNGISVHMSYGRRPFKIGVDIERAGEIEFLLKDMKYNKKNKKEGVEFSVRFENKGKYFDLLWELYSIGNIFEI